MKVNYTVPKLTFNLDSLSKSKIVNILKTQATKVVDRLNGEIAKGRGADGQAIKPGGYSESYKKKIAAGQAKGGSEDKGVRKVGTTPNLFISGDLLNSRQVRQTPDGAEIYFLGGHYSGVTNAQHASRLMDKGFNGWHELGPKDVKSVDEAVDKFVDDALKKLMVVK
jgi:hypothetical protein